MLQNRGPSFHPAGLRNPLQRFPDSVLKGQSFFGLIKGTETRRVALMWLIHVHICGLGFRISCFLSAGWKKNFVGRFDQRKLS